MFRATVKTEYVTWENPTTQTLSNEMYPTLVYACASVTFKGNAPGELGKIYAEVEVNNLCLAAMQADPEIEVLGVVELEPEAV
jgi:hypothetical protein